MEIWKKIKQTDDYEISNYGRFRSKRKSLLKCNVNKRGYQYCNISIKGKVSKVKIHILVAEAFVEKSNLKNVVNHKDFNKTNNHYSNLEWLTQKENVHHYYKCKLK